MYYMTGLLNHVKRVQACVVEADGEATVNARDLSLDVRVGMQSRQFAPQFNSWRDGRRFYTPTFSADVRAFIGWRPYAARRWPATAEKLVFKDFASAAGVRTPVSWREASGGVRQFIIKQNKSSFGDGIRGPFERLEAANVLHRLKPGEYYEAFIPGRIAKAWYLNGAWLCLELRPPPFVVGDSRSTVLDLAVKRHPPPVDQLRLSWIVASQGHRLGDVLPDGKRVVIDFKYASLFDDWSFDNENVLSAVRDTSIGKQFQEAGQRLVSAIPDDMRHDTLITLDAIVDESDQVWFLEMNSNPMVHPDTYEAIIKNAFGISLSPSKAESEAKVSREPATSSAGRDGNGQLGREAARGGGSDT